MKSAEQFEKAYLGLHQQMVDAIWHHMKIKGIIEFRFNPPIFYRFYEEDMTEDLVLANLPTRKIILQGYYEREEFDPNDFNFHLLKCIIQQIEK